jgi:uncharacterized protein YbaA (DUF1428 family)
MMSPDFSTPRIDPHDNLLRCDGKRMIFGGFTPALDPAGA